MEFIDPIIDEIPQKPPNHQEGKTEQAVHQLETEIDNAYQSVEKKFSELWTNVNKNAEDLQQKYQLEQRRDELLKQLSAARDSIDDKTKLTLHLSQFEQQLKSLGGQLGEQIHVPDIYFKELGNKANTYLDRLDSGLEIVENQASKYASQFASFFSGIVQINNDTQPEAPVKRETLFSTSMGANPNYGTSRYDSDLFKLHTSPELYLYQADDKELEQFDVDSKTELISQTLKTYDNTLHKLMNELVPVEISYSEFWYKYFKLEENLKREEHQRKKLLENKETKKEGEDEEFTWDDDDEEPVDIGKESNSSYDKVDDKDDEWE